MAIAYATPSSREGYGVWWMHMSAFMIVVNEYNNIAPRQEIHASE
jgi:hypothetical protein